MIEVRILTDTHTHKNEPVAKGDVIQVSESDAEWIVAEGIGELTTTTNTTTKEV